VSNFGAKHIQEFIDQKVPLPTVNQIDLHPFMRHPEIVKICEDNGILLEVSPSPTQFIHSYLSHALRDPLACHLSTCPPVHDAPCEVLWPGRDALTSLVQAWGPLARAMRFNHSAVQSVAKKHGKDEAQIMLRWGLQHVRARNLRLTRFTSRANPYYSKAARHRVMNSLTPRLRAS
jgi:diketogulonate reductase-like aldo/keto reductase